MMAATLKLLVLVTLLIAIGSRIGWRAELILQPGSSLTTDPVRQPFAARAPLIPGSSVTLNRAAIPIPAILFVVWAVGFVATGFTQSLRWRRLQGKLRGASPLYPLGSSPRVLKDGVSGTPLNRAYSTFAERR
jgi:hypothetical protein